MCTLYLPLICLRSSCCMLDNWFTLTLATVLRARGPIPPVDASLWGGGAVLLPWHLAIVFVVG